MTTYKGILTNNGKALLASATITNPVNYSHLAVGDGNGSTPTPLETRAALVNEKARIALNVVEINPNQTNQIICEAIIPTNIGGFHIREFGLFAGSVMIVNGNYPLTYKPAVNEGGAREIAIKVIINVQNAEVIALYLDDSLIYATREWVKNNYIPRADIIDNLTTNDATKPVSAKQAKLLQDSKAGKTTQIIAGTGLSGGGDLSANLTLSVNYGTAAGTAAEGNDSRLSDSREWTAATVSQAEAETGTATTRRAWTAQRVRQAATAMFNAATTVFTRTLLGRSTAAQVRSDLELGTAATRDVTTSNTDSTANRLLKVGDAGILSTIEYNSSISIDEQIIDGIAVQQRTSAPIPPGAPVSGAFKVLTIGSKAYPTQLGFDAYNARFLIRSRETANGNFRPWQEIYSEANFNPADKADKTTQIIAGNGLSGGGNLSANRTLSVNYGTAAGTAAQGNDSRINNGQAAYSWGNHASAGYLIASRNLSDLANAANARINLGLGTAAIHNVTTNNADITENRILKVGDFGVGATGSLVISELPLSVGETNNFSRRVLGNSSAAHGLPTGTFAMSTFATSANNSFAIFYPMNVTQDIYIGNLTLNSGNESVKRFFKLLSEANTTSDINGFLRGSGSANAVPETRTITAGTGLSGGGDLSTNRSLTVIYGTTAGTSVQGNDSRVVNALQKQNNLNDLGNAALARTNLGLGTVATHNVTISQVTHVDDFVMQTGYGGLVKGVSLGTFNLVNPSGFMGFQYEASGSTAGSPGGSAWVINLGNAGVNYAHQIGASIARNELVFRHKNNGTWQDWKIILDDSNVVQGLGTSTSNIISQKAVTDILNLKLNANANAVSASKLATARSVTVTGAIAGTFVFDGSSNVTYNVTLKHGLGIEQTYRDLSASRVSGTTYTNTTGSPIEVMVKLRNNGFPSVGGVAITGTGTDSENTYTFTVSNGQTYMCNGTIVTWAELR